VKTAYRTGHEVVQQGFAALLHKLGAGGAVQFLLQYETGTGDYTAERKRLFRNKGMEEIWEGLKQEARRDS